MFKNAKQPQNCKKSYYSSTEFKHNCTYIRGIFHRLHGLVKLCKMDKSMLATANYHQEPITRRSV